MAITSYIHSPSFLPSLLCFITLYSARAAGWYAYSLLAPSDDEIQQILFQKVATRAIWADNVDVSVRRIGMNQRRNLRYTHMYSIGILGYYNWNLLEEILIKVAFGRNQSESWHFRIPREYADYWIFVHFSINVRPILMFISWMIVWRIIFYFVFAIYRSLMSERN